MRVYPKIVRPICLDVYIRKTKGKKMFGFKKKSVKVETTYTQCDYCPSQVVSTMVFYNDHEDKNICIYCVYDKIESN